MDYFAVVTSGVFPTPTPTDSERAAYFCSWGLLDTAGTAVTVTARVSRWLSRFIRRFR